MLARPARSFCYLSFALMRCLAASSPPPPTPSHPLYPTPTHARVVFYFSQVVETLASVGVLQAGATLSPEELVAPGIAVDADSS